jgi:hypothetical protein
LVARQPRITHSRAPALALPAQTADRSAGFRPGVLFKSSDFNHLPTNKARTEVPSEWRGIRAPDEQKVVQKDTFVAPSR